MCFSHVCSYVFFRSYMPGYKVVKYTPDSETLAVYKEMTFSQHKFIKLNGIHKILT
jgi:hypothetical protein